MGLGTSRAEGEDCAAAVRSALDCGYRHVDTAQMYGNEAAVGRGLRESGVDREEVVLATKVHPSNLGREDVLATTEASLDCLGVDAVDLLYVHWPTEAYDPEETLPAFDELRDRGLTRNVGVSNFTPDLLDEARHVLDAPVVAHQVECHPLFPQRELREYAERHGHTLVGYSPLGRGRTLDHPVVERVAAEVDATPAQVCLAWAMARGVVPIPKGTGDHVAENYRATDVELGEAALDALDGVDDRTRVIDRDDAAWNRD
ncbi:aldo/keto reductase [Halobium salinum]|uniref:Aldo/keto reductase n=1 Tax=Halobium salinum TaxID=1364940 RepID=A0ABD5PI72_9EURY|nr:aldo/keto reductase [Halobium salinum]